MQSMTRRTVECNARTDIDVRLQAEKAAFEAQTLRTFFNSLQARTVEKLSPETRLFAEVCYEKKLIRYISTALIECARNEQGREKAIEISRNTEPNNLRATWKPIVDHCSQLLRSLKLEATNARLSRLSDHWSKFEEGVKQAERLKEVVQNVVHYSIERANSLCEEICDWVELYSIPYSPIRDNILAKPDAILQAFKRKIVVVDQSETFSQAIAFLQQELDRGSRIHVIAGNGDDGLRFYRAIYDRLASYGLQLNWREKKYGRRLSPRIIIGTREYFVSQNSEWSSLEIVSAVFLHMEYTIEYSIENSFELGSLDDYLAEIFTLVAITMKHFDEIEDMITRIDYPLIGDLSRLVKSWPNENQILEPDKLENIWSKGYSVIRVWNKIRFMESLRTFTRSSLEGNMRKYKVAHNLRGYVEIHGSKFIQSAIVARAAELGQDYVVYAERSSKSLTMKIRLKKQVNGDFGLQQFLEMRHGCAMTSYKVPKGWETAKETIKRYTHVLIVQRSNHIRDPSRNFNISNGAMREYPLHLQPMKSQSTIDKFPNFVATAAKVLNDYQIIVVCPTVRLLNSTVEYLKDANFENVFITETALGISNEAVKNATGTLIACTTSACFEGWPFLPRTRNSLRILVCYHYSDTSALEVACDLATIHEVESINIPIDHLERMKRLNVDREPGTTLWKKFYTKFMSNDSNLSEPEALIEKYSRDNDINYLLQAKEQMHKTLRRISRTTKVVYSRLPAKKLASCDSPMDISCNGYLEKSRLLVEEVSTMLNEVERRLISHGTSKGLHKAIIDEGDLRILADRHIIPFNDLESFVRGIRMSNKPVHWNDVRAKIAQRFDLNQDAENHWAVCYRDRQSRSDKRLIALSSECVSSATSFLNDLRLINLPENYKKSLLQCSDQPLDDCTLYYPESELDEEKLLEMDGASVEYISLSAKELRQQSHSTLLNTVAIESWDRQCPLYLFPRRCYDRLTRDLFDSGILICKDYEAAEQQMHMYDTIKLPIITDTSRRSSLDRLLGAESALMEYGTLKWMEWMARRLRYSNYDAEVIRFHLRTVAERDYCAQDERLIQRLGDALTNASLGKATSNIDQMRVDAFIYNTMDILQRGERLVVIEPPFSSTDALALLTRFIRSRRMPPSDL